MTDQEIEKLRVAHQKALYYTGRYIIETTGVETINNCPKGPHIKIYLKSETVAKLPPSFEGIPVEYVIGEK